MQEASGLSLKSIFLFMYAVDLPWTVMAILVAAAVLKVEPFLLILMTLIPGVSWVCYICDRKALGKVHFTSAFSSVRHLLFSDNINQLISISPLSVMGL